MNRPIKFRQRIGEGGWHYWGYLNGLKNGFTTPLTSTDDKGQIPESSQFTGLLDKNGKEIYEGDIVKHRFYTNEKYTKYKVEWSNGGFRTYEDKKKNYFTLTDGREFEIIGNIYENPELLK